MKDKEEKLIKLLLGVKKLGVDLEKIFEEEILQKEETSDVLANDFEENENENHKMKIEK